MTATHALHADSAQRLLQRYRRLFWLVAAPLFLLLAMLAAWQASTAQRAAVGDLERRAVSYHAAAQALALSATDHVADLRRQVERDLAAAPRAPDVALRSAVAERRSAGQPDGYTLDALPSLLRPGVAQLLWPDAATAPDDDTLWRLQSLSGLAELAHERKADFVWSYYFSWPHKHIVMFPWVRSDHVVEQLGRRNMREAIDAWYGYEVFAAGLAAEAAGPPSRLGYWTRAYVDAGGAGLIVSHAAPVYSGDSFHGVVGADIKLSALALLLDALPPGAGRWWVVDQRGDVLARQGTAEAAAEAEAASTVPTLAERLPAGIDALAIAEAVRARGRAVALAGQRVVALELAAAPWVLVNTLSDREVLAQVLPGLVPFAVIGAALLVMFVLGQGLVRRRLIEPALHVMGYLDAMSLDPHTPEPHLGPRWQPWIAAVTATFRAQREARERERRSEVFKSAIVDNALAALVASDADGHIVEFNPAAERLFGRPRGAVLGLLVADVIVPPRLRAAHAEGMKRMREGGPPRVLGQRMEMPALRADGSEFTAEMVLWRTEVDGLAHYTASLSDVSAARDAAREIERQREALRQAEKLTAMGSLLAGVAHELNNPLAIVMGRADLLVEKCEHHPELRSDAQRIRDAAERCGRIVKTFLNMARSRPAQRGNVSLNELARAATEMLGYAYRSHGIELTLALHEPLPAVHADGDQIGQVVLNLLVNAQQALAGATAARRVWLATGVDAETPGSSGVWLSVADSGPGVPPQLREQIFEPFFTTKADGLGTGLGLALSRALVREHGGELALWPAAAPASGASFRMRLPLAGQPALPIAGPAPGGGTRGAAALRLLVVDDEAEIAELMRSMLEAAGHEVFVAESGAVALELLGAARHDAVISDLRMPDMDGAALWREVVRREPRLARRMLFVTGDALSADAQQFLRESGCPSLEKPFAKEALLAHVNRWFGRMA